MIENITFNVSMKMVVPVEYDENGHHIDVLNHIAPFVDEMVCNYKNSVADRKAYGDFSKVQIPFTEDQLEDAWRRDAWRNWCKRPNELTIRIKK